jgi:mono/diheme cytochrome c family protein
LNVRRKPRAASTEAAALAAPAHCWLAASWVRRCLRWRARAALLAAALLVVSAAASLAAEPIWISDLEEATSQAQKQGKLLLVIHLNTDFAVDGRASKAAQLFRAVALSDDQLQKRLQSRFVVVCQGAGASDRLRGAAATRGKSTSRVEPTALTYFCLPDGRVLHFVPGYLTSAELGAAVDWVEATYAKLLRVPAREMEHALRECHGQRIHAADRQVFAASFPSRWSAGELKAGPSTADLPAALTAARNTFARSLRQRVASETGPRAASVLSTQGTIGAELAHLVMSEFPLISLADLQRPAFETWARQRYWAASPRRAMLAAWWNERVARDEPALLVIADDVFAWAEPTVADPKDSFAWPPAASADSPELQRIANQIVSVDELAQLMADADIPPIRYSLAHGPPRFLLARHGGEAPLVIRKSEAAARLVRLLAAESGTVRGALIAKKEQQMKSNALRSWLVSGLGIAAALAGAGPLLAAKPLTLVDHGRELFERQWVAGEVGLAGGDGLGPMFNHVSCAACHRQGGLGGAGPVDVNALMLSVNIPKLPEAAQRKEFLATLKSLHPGFLTASGDIQQNLILHRFSTDPRYTALRQRLAGPDRPFQPSTSEREAIQSDVARRPFRTATPTASVTLAITERNTPALFGARLIDAIPDAVFHSLAAAQSKHPEVSGRVAPVEVTKVGRFGWRGQIEHLHDFVLGACANEMGLEVPGQPQPVDPLLPSIGRLDWI